MVGCYVLVSLYGFLMIWLLHLLLGLVGWCLVAAAGYGFWGWFVVLVLWVVFGFGDDLCFVFVVLFVVGAFGWTVGFVLGL